MSLTLADIRSRLTAIDELKDKVAYYSSRDEMKTPYCFFYGLITIDRGDYMHPASLGVQRIVIELYTRKIDVELETAVEKQFADFDLEKSESWIEDSKEYQIRYSFINYLK